MRALGNVGESHTDWYHIRKELGTVIRQGFHPTIILINNSGYTIERVIHGPTRSYNDISETWDYQNMLKFFGASSESKSYTARTYEELRAVLEDPEFAANQHIQLLEAFMDKYDAPWNMLKLVKVGSERAAEGLKKWDGECGRRRVVKDTNLLQSDCVLKDSPSYRKAVE
jgi:pyruvate decarboxylase